MKASWGLRPGMPTLPEKAPPLLCCFICLCMQSGFLSIDITKSKYRSSLKKHWSCLASIQPRFNSHVKTNKHIYLFSVHICVCAKWEDCLHTGELFKMYLVMIYYQQMPDSPCYDIHDMVGLVKIFSGQERVQVEKSLRCLILFYFILSLLTLWVKIKWRSSDCLICFYLCAYVGDLPAWKSMYQVHTWGLQKPERVSDSSFQKPVTASIQWTITPAPF